MLDIVLVNRPSYQFHDLCDPDLSLTPWLWVSQVPSLAPCSSFYIPFMPYYFLHRRGPPHLPTSGHLVATFSAALPNSISSALTPHQAIIITLINPEWVLRCPIFPTASKTLPQPHPITSHHQLKFNITKTKSTTRSTVLFLATCSFIHVAHMSYILCRNSLLGAGSLNN